ncbi:TPA: LamG domain-containing protein, partial [Candidatus Micrarchaeota archaeon]|nr:LamG domain-containing protein [Candidatus Micrarchaeota archaeon]
FYNSFNNWSRIFDFGEGQANDNILLANYGTTNNLTFEVYVGGTSGGKVTANGILETGVWMHLVAVMDVGGNVVLYKNGAQIQTGTTGVPAAVNRTSSFIGKSNWSWEGYFNGLMDDIAIWNSALTAVNVNALYNSGIGLDASSNLGNYIASESLVGYWAMNEGTGTIVADGSVNSNTGTLTNGTFWDTGPRTGNYAGYVSGSGSSTLTFNYRVANGNSSSDLDYRDTTAMILNSGTITDASGNNADLILPVPGNAGSLGANKALVIDGVIPTVSSVTSVAANTAYGAGDTLLLTLNFNKAVTVTGTPQLALETGTTDAVISYTSGSGTNALNFQYIVATGDTS